MIKEAKKKTMTHNVYRYTFDKNTSLAEVRDSLLLAMFSAEGLHGRARVRLDAIFEIDEKKGTCEVDATTPVGQSIVEIFTGLLTREFGDDAFAVERVDYESANPPAQASDGESQPEERPERKVLDVTERQETRSRVEEA